MQHMGEESRLLPPRAGHDGREHRRGARAPEPELPSWPTVLRTTIRLWTQRRLQAMARRRWRMAAVVTAVALILAASVIAIAHVSDRGDALSYRPARSAAASSSGRRQHHASAYAAPAFAAARQAAAAWIASQVAAGAKVACDQMMCQALADAGLAGADLVRLGPLAPGDRGASLLVATPEARQELGAALAGGYAPVILASFGTGRASVQVRAVAADGAAAYLAALRADLHARRSAGRRLLRTGRLVVTKTVRRQLAAGHADSRLLLILAALARRARPDLTALSDAGPGAAAALPLRAAELSRPPSVPARDTRSYLKSLLRLVRRSRPRLGQLGSASATIIGRGHGRYVLRIEFPAPSPLGLLELPEARAIISRA
jgi:hypothetical protein